MPPTTKVFSYLRFSTSQQLKGDSLRRQLERSKDWCKTNGFVLDETLAMQDHGLSAFSGAHKAKGALGLFLKAVEAGTIPPGSILLVESLDRLSREDVVDAQTQFLNIVKAGVEIVTLMDGYRYSRKSIKENWTQLIITLNIMARANEESRTKADRLGEAWRNKRKNTHKRKLTSIAPKWLKLNRETQVFEPIPEHVKTVQRIFQECLDGFGAYAITRLLNEEKVPTFGRSDKWGISFIKKILHNRSVLGEFQPHRLMRDGAKKLRVPEGEPIQDYFPRIIEDDVFNAVQRRSAEKTGKGGRTGFMRNLFQHVVECGKCGARAQYSNKGEFQYLRCVDSQAGRGCDATPWSYQDFEDAFLQECRELDISSVLPDGNGTANKIEAARLSVDAVNGELADLQKRITNMERTIELAESEAVIAMFVKKLDNALSDKKDAENRLKAATIAFQAAQSVTITTKEKLKSVQALIRKIKPLKDDESIQLRERLKNTIAQLVDRITIFPDGLGVQRLTGDAISGYQLESINDVIAHWENIGPDPDIFKSKAQYDSVIGELASYEAQNRGKDNRALLIHFKTGGYRLLKREGGVYINTVSTMETILSYST